jgi:transcriptional regulator with XRE-family HTH domain
MSLFSKNLRFLRKKGNYKQDEISVLFNKQANTIGNWENGKSEPSLAELIKLGEYFKISVQDFLHSDLESQSFHPGQQPALSESKITPVQRQEAVNPSTKEGGQDAFWIILKELRAVNEKMDLLVSQMGLTTFNKTSDKSAH